MCIFTEHIKHYKCKLHCKLKTYYFQNIEISLYIISYTSSFSISDNLPLLIYQPFHFHGFQHDH